MKLHLQRPDLIGLALLAGLTALPLLFVGDLQASAVVWLVGYLALASLGLFAWASERWPAQPSAALKLAAAAAAAGVAVFAVAAAVAMWRWPDLGFVDAGLKTGPALALAFALCPCLTCIALAGAVRNVFMRRIAVVP